MIQSLGSAPTVTSANRVQPVSPPSQDGANDSTQLLREQALSQTLQQKLDLRIAVIRQRMGDPSPPGPSPDGVGSRLDIRA